MKNCNNSQILLKREFYYRNALDRPALKALKHFLVHIHVAVHMYNQGGYNISTRTKPFFGMWLSNSHKESSPSKSINRF